MEESLTSFASQLSLIVVNSARSGSIVGAVGFGLCSWSSIESVAISSYQVCKANEEMETLLSIALLMVAVDGPVTPSELSQDIQNGTLADDSSSRSSAWTGGPEVNMWTGGDNQAADDLLDQPQPALR